MLFYLPERLYKKLGSNINYSELSDKIDKRKEKIHSFKEYIEADNEQSKRFLSELKTIKSFCRKKLKDDPILLKEFDINNGEYTKKEMIQMYEIPDDTIDTENKFYLLSNIVNKAYEDTSTHDEYLEEYEKYMDLYKDLYETLDENTIKTLSKYVWLKYMYCKIWDLCRVEDLSKENWIDDIYIKTLAIYDNQVKLTKDPSITMNYFMEAACAGINVLGRSGATNDQLHSLIVKFRNYIGRQEFQYKECSFAYLKLLDMECMDYLASGDATSFLNQCKIIYAYISNAFFNLPNTLRGLAYYDKVNHNMWCVLVRQYILLREQIPLLQTIPLENISKEDYKFITGDELCNTVNVANPNRFSEVNFREGIDSFFANGDWLIERMKKIGV